MSAKIISVDPLIIKGKKDNWKVTIGLEVHCQIKSNAKLFSYSPAAFDKDHPNKNISNLDVGLPGTLPQMNFKCIEQAAKTSAALNGKINPISYFDRKHYFYPDLPLGYQITQFYQPIMQNGSVRVYYNKTGLPLEKTTNKNDINMTEISIERLHIEQDAGKLSHDILPGKSAVDYNRAGFGLMEIVTGPDIQSHIQAGAYVNTLKSILKNIGTSDADMEKGSLRCDVNISVSKVSETSLRNRCEIKNLNSIRFIEEAIKSESVAQVEQWEAFESGDAEEGVEQATKLFDQHRFITKILRKKSEAEGYRYIREPDLLPVKLDSEYIQKLYKEAPQYTPYEQNEQLKEKYNLNNDHINIFNKNHDLFNLFNSIIHLTKNSNVSSSDIGNFIIKTFRNKLIEEKIENASNITLTHEDFANMFIEVKKKNIAIADVSKIFNIMWDSKSSSIDIPSITDKFIQVEDTDIINKIILDTFDENKNMLNKMILEYNKDISEDNIKRAANNKKKMINTFIGTIRKSNAKLNLRVVNKILAEEINKKLVNNNK